MRERLGGRGVWCSKSVAGSRSARLLREIHFLQSSLEKAKSQYKAQLATDFNAVDLFTPDEMQLSKIIAWLLNIDLCHTQGPGFFVSFCAHFAIDWPQNDIHATYVLVEEPISGGRRVDILIAAPKRRSLIIENKPWACDQKDQLQDYLLWGLRQGIPCRLSSLSGNGH